MKLKTKTTFWDDLDKEKVYNLVITLLSLNIILFASFFISIIVATIFELVIVIFMIIVIRSKMKSDKNENS